MGLRSSPTFGPGCATCSIMGGHEMKKRVVRTRGKNVGQSGETPVNQTKKGTTVRTTD